MGSSGSVKTINMRSVIVLAVILLSPCTRFLPYCIAAEKTPFEEEWALEKTESKSTFFPSTLDLIKDRQVVLVSGFINELGGPIGGYFYAAVDAVKKDLEMTTTLFLPKTPAFSTNITAIYHAVLEAYEKEQKPVILIGHSKGGEEILHTILRHPDLMLENKVDRVLLIQSAIQGVSLLDDNQLRSSIIYMKKVSEFFFEGIECLDPKLAKEKLDLSFEVFKRDRLP